MINKLKRFIDAVPPSMWRLSLFNLLGDLFVAFYAFISAGILQGFAYHLGFVKKESILPVFYFLTKSEWLVFVLLLSSTIILGIASFVSMYVQLIMAETYTLEARKRLTGVVFEQKVIYTKSMGEVVTILGEIIPKAGGFFASLIKFVTLLAQALLIISFCFYVAFGETIIVLLALFIFAPLIKHLNNLSRQYGGDLISQMNRVTAELMQSIRNINFLKIIGRENEQKNKVINHCVEYFKKYRHYCRIYSFTNVVPSMYGMIIVMAIFYFSRFILGTPALALFTFYYLLMRFVPVASQAVGITNGLSMSAPSFIFMAKLHEENKLLEKDRAKADILIPKKELTASFHPKSLEVIEIAFKYPGDRSDKFIFEKISFKVDFSSCLVIQGASGSGKSTLLYSILGLYPPTKGKVLWDGILLNELPFDKFREAISYVGPEAFLKEGTILENLCYGLSHIPAEKELIEAAIKADCLDFINESKQGWKTMIMENGVGLSAGQKQRLGFARAYLRNPKILILDEATSNLDTETETRIVDNLRKIKHEMIIIAASHRDKILEIADQRIFMGGAGIATVTN